MARYRHLRHAPITEALIDLRVTLPAGTIEKLKELPDRIKEQFPLRKEMMQGQFVFKLGPEPGVEPFQGAFVGWVCSSSDESKKVQFRGDGFTFNKLKPYETWETMRAEALALWELFASNIPANVPINRVALRFINHIDIPIESTLQDVLMNPPTIPDGLPQGVTEYLNRVVLVNPAIDSSFAIVTQSLLPAKPEMKVRQVLIDIDIVRAHPVSNEEAWALLDQFRDFKNDIFFKSITEKTAEIFQ